jgi:hypothetical protein
VFRLNDDVTLRLKSRTLVRRSSSLATSTDRDKESTSTTSESKPTASRKSGHGARGPAWFAVVGTVIVALIAILLLTDSSDPLESQVRSELHELFVDVHRPGRSAAHDPRQTELCHAIQTARIAMLRGDAKAASTTLAAVRDALLQRRRPDGSFEGPRDEQCLSLVKKLERLGVR